MKEVELRKGQKAYLKGVVNKFKSDANTALQEISDLKVQLLKGDPDDPGLITDLINTQKEIDEIYNRVYELDKSIFKTEDIKGRTLSDRIGDFVDVFTESEDYILKMQDNIINYNNRLLGYEDEDGEKIDGIKQEIENVADELITLYNSNLNKQKNLFNKIESLLKGASTVALAKSFREHKESFNKINNRWITVFLISIAILMGMSIFSFIMTDYKIEDMWKYTLGNLPLIGGAIWLAFYATKQRSQNKRLQQEYAYKEDVAKIYYGLKKEVENMKDTSIGSKLNEQVLKTIISVVAINLSETLDSKSHNDKGPVIESLENIKEIVSSFKSPKI